MTGVENAEDVGRASEVGPGVIGTLGPWCKGQFKSVDVLEAGYRG